MPARVLPEQCKALAKTRCILKSCSVAANSCPAANLRKMWTHLEFSGLSVARKPPLSKSVMPKRRIGKMITKKLTQPIALHQLAFRGGNGATSPATARHPL